jgi:hypothetical protein
LNKQKKARVLFYWSSWDLVCWPFWVAIFFSFAGTGSFLQVSGVDGPISGGRRHSKYRAGHLQCTEDGGCRVLLLLLDDGCGLQFSTLTVIHPVPLSFLFILQRSPIDPLPGPRLLAAWGSCKIRIAIWGSTNHPAPRTPVKRPSLSEVRIRKTCHC